MSSTATKSTPNPAIDPAKLGKLRHMRRSSDSARLIGAAWYRGLGE